MGDHDHGISLEAARDEVRACFAPVADTEEVPLEAARGRVLAEDVVSRVDVPGFDNSAMDGFALAASSLAPNGATDLPIAGEAFAGRPFAEIVSRGACARVMTGAPIPAGCDTVVMQEHAEHDAGARRVRIPSGQRAGQHVRRRGEDISVGDVVLQKGRALRPVDVGAVASVGCASVRVFRRPRVAFFSTGDELRPAGAPLGPGQLWDSNRHVLRGLLEECGVETVDLGDVPDDVERLREALARAASSVDAIVSTGGVSVGAADHVLAAATPLGHRGKGVRALEVRMKPGKHYVIGALEGGSAPGTQLLRGGAPCAFVGLPGNPVAVVIGFLQLVRPALLACAGRDPAPAVVRLDAICTTPLRASKGRTELQRGVAWREHGEGARWFVRTTGAQGAGVLRSLTEANCLIVLRDRGDVAAGELVEVELLPEA